MRILLLNPPGKKKYLRDCYCSSISKSGYVWHPADLLSASALLNGNNLFIIDCIAENLSVPEVSSKIKEFSPQIVYMLISSLSINEDIEFAKNIKRIIKGVKIICSGEPVLLPNFLDKYAVFDGIVLNYTNKKLKQLCEGLIKNENNFNIVDKNGQENNFSIGIPIHESFKKDRYWLPFVRLPFATLITDFGCPYSCKFCNSNFHFAKRYEEEVLEDIKRISKLNYQHVFIKDMTFLIDKIRSLKFAEEIARHNLTFNCYSKIDLIDKDILFKLKRLGLRLIQFGIEDYDDSILKKEGKNITLDKAISLFRYSREIGLFTGAHFIIGLPSRQKRYEYSKLIRLIRDLQPSYVSINFFQIRSGSYYEKMGINNSNKPDKNLIHKLFFLLTKTLITDPIKDINLKNFRWYFKSLYYIIKSILWLI